MYFRFFCLKIVVFWLIGNYALASDISTDSYLADDKGINLSYNQVESTSKKIFFSDSTVNLAGPFSHHITDEASYRRKSTTPRRISSRLYALFGYRYGGDAIDTVPVQVGYNSVALSVNVGTVGEIGVAFAVEPFENFRLQTQVSIMLSSFGRGYSTSRLRKNGLDITAYYGNQRQLFGIGLSAHSGIEYSKTDYNQNTYLAFSGDTSTGWHIATLIAGNQIGSEMTIKYSQIDYFVPYLNRTVDASTLDIQWLIPITTSF